MDGFETSLGVPGTKIVESIHDRQHSNQQKQRKHKQKSENEKQLKQKFQDHVQLSVTCAEESDSSEKHEVKQSPRGKGVFIDVQA